MKITAYDDLYPGLIASGGTTLVFSSGSNSAEGDLSGGGDVVGEPGDYTVVGLRSTVALASNIGGGTVGDVLTITSTSPRIAMFATSSNSGASFGSNATRVSETASMGGLSTAAREDHIHDGIGTITASSSNTMQRGTFNLRPGSNVSFGLTDGDGDGEFDTLTINGGAAGSGGGDTFADLGWYNVEDYGAVHDGVTDDTAAIQDTIDACFAAGGGTVYFPLGIYQIDGALQDTGTYNAQIEIPDNAPGDWMAIRLLGAGAAAPNHVESASVLRSSWDGAISGNPAIISAGTHDSTSPNYVVVTFENIVIEAHEDPKITAIDMTAALGCRLIDAAVTVSRAEAFTFPVPWDLPTHSNAVGVDMPYGFNSQPFDGGTAVYTSGFYIGIRPSEQTSILLVQAAFCAQGIVFRGGVGSPGYRRHVASIEHGAVFWTPRAIVFTGDEVWVNIGTIDIEHDSGVFTAVYDIDDASNYGRGFIGWFTTDFTNGPEDNLLVNGAAGLSLFGPYARRWKLNNVVDIPTGADPSTNPTNGFRLYAASATGKPTTRSSAGTVTTLMREGDSAGGDLAGTYPNPTVSDDSHSHTAATLPANTGSGEILVSDTPAGSPLVFADLLQNEAGNDLLYEG